MLNISKLQQNLVHERIQITNIRFTIPENIRAKVNDKLPSAHPEVIYTQRRVVSDNGLTMELDFPRPSAFSIINTVSKKVAVNSLSVRSKLAISGDPEQVWNHLIKYAGSPYIKGIPKVTDDRWSLSNDHLQISLQRKDSIIWLDVTLDEKALARQGVTKISDVAELDLRKAMTKWVWLVKPNMTTVGAIIRKHKKQPRANALTNRKTFHDLIEPKNFAGQFLVRHKLFQPGICNKSGVLFGLKDVDGRKWVRVMQ
jgi:hypothetical protein